MRIATNSLAVTIPAVVAGIVLAVPAHAATIKLDNRGGVASASCSKGENSSTTLVRDVTGVKGAWIATTVACTKGKVSISTTTSETLD